MLQKEAEKRIVFECCFDCSREGKGRGEVKSPSFSSLHEIVSLLISLGF